jgi:hypothetical protein
MNNRRHVAQLRMAAVVGVIVLAGCGSQAPSPSTANTGTAGKNGEVHLTLITFQLEDAQGRPLTMSAVGVITSPQGPWGRVHEDGTVTSPDGALRGKLLPTGSVVDAQGSELATIADDGSAKVGAKELHFDADGKLVGGDPSQAMQLRATDPGARRIAMLVLIMAELSPTKQ